MHDSRNTKQTKKTGSWETFDYEAWEINEDVSSELIIDKPKGREKLPINERYWTPKQKKKNRYGVWKRRTMEKKHDLKVWEVQKTKELAEPKCERNEGQKVVKWKSEKLMKVKSKRKIAKVL